MLYFPCFSEEDVLILSVIVIVVLILSVAASYNGLVRAKGLAQEAWAGIDIQLKRRHDLLPLLVETVKGYAGHEKSVIANVSERRGLLASSTPAQIEASETQVGQSVRGLLALSEAYPDLKANQSFVALQQRITDVEEQLQMARRYYNGTVRDYNIRIQSIPSCWLAGPLGYQAMPYFELPDASDRTSPALKL